jgi:hypothetical protein
LLDLSCIDPDGVFPISSCFGKRVKNQEKFVKLFFSPSPPLMKIGIPFAYNLRFSFDICKVLVYLGFEDGAKWPRK